MPRAKGGRGVRWQRAACAGCSCRLLSEPPVRCVCARPCTSCTLPLHVCGTGHEQPAHWSRTCVNVTPVKCRLRTMHAWTACCGRADCTFGMCRLSPGTIRLHVGHMRSAWQARSADFRPVMHGMCAGPRASFVPGRAQTVRWACTCPAQRVRAVRDLCAGRARAALWVAFVVGKLGSTRPAHHEP